MAQIGDLTTLAAVKTWLNTSGQPYPPGDDANLSALITRASRFIQAYLSRAIPPADYVETRNGTGTGSLFLRNRPVLSVSALTVYTTAIQQATSPDAVGYLFDDSRVYLPGTIFPAGVQNIKVAYTAGFQATAQIVVPDNGTPLSVAGLSGTSAVDGTPAGSWNSDRGVVLADGTVLAKAASDPAAGQYALKAGGDGTYAYVFNAAQNGASATVTYGYTPAEIEECAVELVGERAKVRNRIGQVSVHLGPSQTVSYSQKDFNDFVRTTLNQYKNVVPV